MLESREVVAAIRAMEIPVLDQTLSENCNEEFIAFVAQLRAIKNGAQPTRAAVASLTITRG
jgi:hypothetical protein